MSLKVIGAGNGRTGTFTTKLALEQLGFRPCLRSMLPVFKIVDHLWDDVFQGRFEDRDYTIARYEQMNNDVIEGVRSDQLLGYNVADGWEPLCRFLDVEIPATPLPRCHKRADFGQMTSSIRADNPLTHHLRR